MIGRQAGVSRGFNLTLYEALYEACTMTSKHPPQLLRTTGRLPFVFTLKCYLAHIRLTTRARTNMPKARTTCTRCSMRRQKCDKKQPCSRCVQANEAANCSRNWDGGYDPSIHRAYPKNPLPDGSVAASQSPSARSSTITPRARHTLPGYEVRPSNRQTDTLIHMDCRAHCPWWRAADRPD